MSLEHVAILGAGRAGCAIYSGLSAEGYTPTLWTRSPASAEAARENGFPALAGPVLPSLDGASLVLLAVSDAAVSPVAQQLAGRIPSGAVVAHLAGALDLSPLAPLAASGVPVGSMHPLVSIATWRSPLGGGTAAVDASTPEADALLTTLAEQLGLFVIRPKGDRARYHAAACLAGNFPQVLLEAGSRLLQSLGLTPNEATRALGPLLQSASRNASQLGPSAGLTGPIARGDVEVVRSHLGAIDEPAIAELYRAAGRIAVDLARQRAAPNQDAIASLLREK